MEFRIQLSVAALLLAACADSPTGPEPLLTELPRQLSAAESRLVAAGNRFSFDLFRVASASLPPDSNAFLSPLSASFALGMVLNGAGTETFDAMRATLRFGVAPIGEVNQGYHDLMALLTGLDRTTEVTVANGVWTDAGFPVLPAFVTAARTWFDAEVQSLPFASPATVGTINRWVSDRTRGRIPQLLDRIGSEEVALLINALYFKGRWRIPFDPARTRPLPFHGANGVTRTVPMMSLEPRPLRYVATPDYQAVDLLYGNGAFALTLLLPEPGHQTADLLAGLASGGWETLAGSFGEHTIGLVMPKFRMDYSRSLREDLTALGMGIAFDPARADLSGIADVRPERLYLTRVIQKTFVEVNEEGTEAAAATAVGVGVTSMPPVMTVDRPFLFAIRERLSNTILFIGQINQLP